MSEMKNGIFDQIRRSASEQWNKVQENLNTPDAKGSILDCILDTLKGVFDKGKEIFSPESIKIALAYTEISKENLSFNDLISLIKQNYNLTQGMKVCVLKSKSENGVLSAFTVFDVVACSPENEVLFKPSFPWVHVIVANPDPELISMYADKTMLVLR